MKPTPQRCDKEMTIMISGSVRDAVKPITIVAFKGPRTVWLRVCGSHDVQSSHHPAAHKQDGYPVATDLRCSLPKSLNRYLTEESIPDCQVAPAMRRARQAKTQSRSDPPPTPIVSS